MIFAALLVVVWLAINPPTTCEPTANISLADVIAHEQTGQPIPVNFGTKCKLAR